MQKHEREALAAILDEVAKWDCTAVEDGRSHSHLKVKIERDGHFLGHIKIGCSPTGKEFQATFARQQVRRLITRSAP